MKQKTNISKIEPEQRKLKFTLNQDTYSIRCLLEDNNGHLN